MNKPIQVEQTPVDALIPFARNARTHSDEQVKQIAASIREFGFNNPILIRDDLTVIAGHGRLAAAKVLGLKEVPTISLAHLTPLQVRAYVLADNKLALNAGWDDEMLALELQELALEGFDAALTGFDEVEIGALLADKTEEGLTDEDAVPETPADPTTKMGDVWLLGKHRVMCGDSTSTDAANTLMEGKKADLVFTDPPYGVNFRSNIGKRFDVLMNDDKILDISPIIWQLMDENTAAFIWTSHHVYPEWRAQFSEFYKQTIIWHKGGSGMGDLTGQYALDYEIALFCTKGSPKFRGKRGMAVWNIGKDAALSYVHPTQKPTSLAERAIEDFSDSQTLVLDLFGGSGSTLIACEKKRRNARLMELDPKYCDVIVKRWQDFTGKKATLESNGKTFDELKTK